MSAESDKASPQQSPEQAPQQSNEAAPAAGGEAPASSNAAKTEDKGDKPGAAQALQGIAKSIGGALQAMGGRAGRKIGGVIGAILSVPLLVFRGSIASRLISVGFVASVLLLTITGYKLSKRFMPRFQPSKSVAATSFNAYLEQQKEYAIASASVVFLERYTATVKSEAGKVANLEVELYAECDAPDTCTAVKARMSAIKEVISSAIQEQSYDDLITDEGKDTFKAMLVREINRRLSGWDVRGNIRRVFFSHFIMA
jgi:flagellar basal body-associated protein FliL